MTERKKIAIMNEVLGVLNKHRVPPPTALAILHSAIAAILEQTVGTECAERYADLAEEFIVKETNNQMN
jgi:uncharacterized protein YejL (UPF0352 family)